MEEVVCAFKLSVGCVNLLTSPIWNGLIFFPSVIPYITLYLKLLEVQIMTVSLDLP